MQISGADHTRARAACKIAARDAICRRAVPSQDGEEACRTSCPTYVVPIAIVAVAIVLVLGLVNMMRGGSPNTSQKLMRLRVLLQFVAVVVIMMTIWVMGR